ncbi:MAG: hypothetical protein ACUVQ6_01220 [Dissulfurimicrobium sp.]
MVGPNGCGKSIVVDAIRIISNGCSGNRAQACSG